jgi:chromosome segregation ATPase
MLARRHSAGSLILSQAPALSEEAYRQGLSDLGDALELIEDTGEPQRQQLEREITELEAQLAAAQGNPLEAGMVDALQDQLASKKDGLERFRRRRLRLEQRLNRCRRYAESLDQTREGLQGLKDDSAESMVSAVTQPLRRVMEQAREVQEELNQSAW